MAKPRKVVRNMEKKGTKKDIDALSLKSLKKIIGVMEQADIMELNLEQNGIKLHLKKANKHSEFIAPSPVIPNPVIAAPLTSPVVNASSQSVPNNTATAEDKKSDSNLHTITSPMVGTFYRAPSPDAKAYIEVGSEVEESTVVCIVEAMKLMNEIKAEIKGTIKKILVENAQAIEYGQPLFLVEPKG